jgi:hypothetical protein
LGPNAYNTNAEKAGRDTRAVIDEDDQGNPVVRRVVGPKDAAAEAAAVQRQLERDQAWQAVSRWTKWKRYLGVEIARGAVSSLREEGADAPRVNRKT